MPGATMTAAELAAEFGRRPDWLYDNWRSLAAGKRIPPPLHDTPPFVWNRAQVYAYLDQNLPAGLRPAAAAYRAAVIEVAATIAATPETTETIEWQHALEQRYRGRA